MKRSEEFLSKLKKYCGSGLQSINPSLDDDDISRSSEQISGTSPIYSEEYVASVGRGIQVWLTPNYKSTPAEKAGIKNGDVITHFNSGNGWQSLKGAKGGVPNEIAGSISSAIEVLVETPGISGNRRLTIQREWIVPISPYDPSYTGPEVPAIIRDNLHAIPHRSEKDKLCELVGSVDEDSLMQLSPLRALQPKAPVQTIRQS